MATPFEVAGEAVGVAGVAEHPRLLQPVGGQQPLLVEQVQVGRPVGVRRGGGAHQPRQQGVGDLRVGVHLGDGGGEVGPVAVQPQREGLPPVGAQPGVADERVEAERPLELRGRRGVDLPGCGHLAHSSANGCQKQRAMVTSLG